MDLLNGKASTKWLFKEERWKERGIMVLVMTRWELTKMLIAL